MRFPRVASWSTVAFALAGAITCFAALAATGRADAQVLTFGVVPQLAASKLARQWAPILQYVSEKTGLTIQFKTARDMTTFEQRLATGEYDLAYMNPHHYVVFSEAPGYRAFAKQKDKQIQGILVSRKDTAVRSIEDLDGAEIVFPSPTAFAASIIPRAYLRKQGITFTPKYVNSHDSVYRNVAQGLHLAGGGIVRTLKGANRSLQEDLIVLWTSPGFTSHAFASHPRVGGDVLARIQEALVAMAADPAGRALLKVINFKGIEAARTEDWDDMRSREFTTLDPVQLSPGR